MKIKIRIEKKYAYIIASLIVLVVVAIVATAQTTSYATPKPNPGHFSEEVYITSTDGNQKTLQQAINDGDFKPYKGKFQTTLYNSISTITPDSSTDVTYEQLGAIDTTHHVCMIYSMEMTSDDPFTCGVYPDEIDQTTDNVLDTKRKWYAAQTNKVKCKIICLDWVQE